MVIDIGKEDLILGYSWLRKTNPTINWKEATITFPLNIRQITKATRLAQEANKDAKN
jgi:hypothetical protein